MLLIGLVSGAVLAALILGVQEGNNYELGSGLRTLFTSREPPRQETETRVVKTKREDKLELDFYTVLPKIERIISDSVEPEPSRGEENVRYVLQVASYTSFNEADRLKAQLTITGFDAAIQKVTIEDKGVYYRVRIGPFESKRKLKNVEQQLARQGIKGISLRVTDP